MSGVIGPTGPASPIRFTDPANTTISGLTGPSEQPKVVLLAERVAREVIEITELEPYDGTFVGKRINPDGSITPYPERTLWWRQSVAQVPATIPALFAYLREARKRNVCTIRDAPANIERQPTRRQIAEIAGRGDHGFIDKPTRRIIHDIDGFKTNWRADPERAIREILSVLGEPWVSASCVWYFSASHGLEFNAHKRWTGNIVDGVVRTRLEFIGDRELSASEHRALTTIAGSRVPEIDPSLAHRVHINYIRRPHWVEYPDRDILGDIPTIGYVKGTRDTLAVPDDLAHTARWAKAQGHDTDIADHPDAETAVRNIGCENKVRPHVLAAVRLLLFANPCPKGVSLDDHAINITTKLQSMIAQHHAEITSNLVRSGRSQHVVDELLQHTNPSWARWLLNHGMALKRKTIRLGREERAEKPLQERWKIFVHTAWAVESAYCKATNPFDSNNPPVTLLPAPVGARKSTLMQAAAVQYVTEHPGKTVVILVPRHELSSEQIDALYREHPEDNYSAAIWRGRHAEDPDAPDPDHPKMCRRSEEATKVEQAILDVETTLCKRGRGEKAIKCPFYDTCAYQRQKPIKANIWFAAHECAVHEMPKTFGDVGWVMFDENPLDAFMFGVDINDQVTLELDTLRTPMPVDEAKFGTSYNVLLYGTLMEAREELYHTLDEFIVPAKFHPGVAVPRQSFSPFINELTHKGGITTIKWTGRHHARDAGAWTWRGIVEPDIRPNTPKEQLESKLQEVMFNATIKKEVVLWELIEAATPMDSGKTYGRIQIHRGKEGRLIRIGPPPIDIQLRRSGPQHSRFQRDRGGSRAGCSELRRVTYYGGTRSPASPVAARAPRAATPPRRRAA